MPDNPALIAWAARALREVELPTGTRVKVRVPSPEALLRNGSLPTNLRSVVLRGVDLESPSTTDAELENALTYVAYLTALTLKAIQDDSGAWVPLDLTPEQVSELDLPGDDLAAIQQIAQRQSTPEQITARSRLARRQITEIEAEAVERKEAGDTVDAWENFRSEPGELDVIANGSDVRTATEHDAVHPGPAGSPDG